MPVAENQVAYIVGWLRQIRNGSAADVIRAAADAQRAADFLTGGGEEASSFSGDAARAGWDFLLLVVVTGYRLGSSQCLIDLTHSLVRCTCLVTAALHLLLASPAVPGMPATR